MFSILNFVLERFLFVYLHVNSATGFPPPLELAEERALFERAHAGDAAARNKLIEHNLRLVAHIVKKYYSSSGETEDLISIGTVGLIKAIDTFNCAYGARFATYAGKCVQNEILMHFRAARRLSCETGLSEAIEYDRDGNPLTYLDIAGEEEDVAETLYRRERALLARRAVKHALSGRERRIVVLRYGLAGEEPLPQRAVANLLGISRSYVSRLEKSAILKIRKFLENSGTFKES